MSVNRISMKTASRSTALVALLMLANTLGGCIPVAATGMAVGTMAAIDRRTIGTQIEDKTIQIKGNQRLGALVAGDEKNYVYVTSFDRRVLLTGLVQNAATRESAARIVREIPDVRVVYNEIELPGRVFDRSSARDTGTTAKVRAAFVKDEQVPVNLVKVTTEAGIVYMLGLLTPEEGDRAAKLASRIEGVNRVVTFFENVPAAGTAGAASGTGTSGDAADTKR